jgi:hypothetical protein
MKTWFIATCLGVLAGIVRADEIPGTKTPDMEQFLPAEVGLNLTYAMSGRGGAFEANIACTQVERTANGKLVVLVEQSGSNTVSRAVLVARAGRILFVPIDSPNVTNPPALPVADLDGAVTRGWAELVAATNVDHSARIGGFWSGWTMMSLVTTQALPKEMGQGLPLGGHLTPDMISVRATGFNASLCRQYTGLWRDRWGNALVQRGVGIIHMGTWDQTRMGNFAGCTLIRGVLPAARAAANPPPSLADPVRFRRDGWQYQIHLHGGPNGDDEPYGFLLYQDQPLGAPDRYGRKGYGCLLTPWGFLSRQPNGSWLPSSLREPSKPAAPARSNFVVRLPPVRMEEPLPQVLMQTSPIASVVAKAVDGPRVICPGQGAPYVATQRFQVIGNLWHRMRNSLPKLPIVGSVNPPAVNAFETGQVVEVAYKFQPWERPVAQDEQVLWKLCRAADRVWGYQLAKDIETNRVSFSK